MLSDHLAITVFTYNRAENLRRTLRQLETSPFAHCSITVLDNHSTDATPDVCREFAGRFENFRAVRHRVNVGLGANYLRAVELSDAPYSWIMTDDEVYDFSDCDDVIAAIEEGEVDLISLGSPGQESWERGLRTTTQELWRRGQRYFFVFTFVAGVIFRTEQFDDTCVALGYRNVDNLYPQLEHVRQCLVYDRPVYVSRSQIAYRNVRPATETVGSTLYWLTAWVRSNRTIPDREMAEAANWQAASSRGAWARLLAREVALERLDHPERLRRELVDLTVGLSWQQRLVLLAVLPLAIVPRGSYRAVRRLLAWRRGASAEPAPQYDELRL